MATNKQFKDKDGNDITDTNAVHKTGAETIDGQKTFTSGTLHNNWVEIRTNGTTPAVNKKASDISDIDTIPTSAYDVKLFGCQDVGKKQIGMLQFRKLTTGKLQLQIGIRNSDGTLKYIVLAESD